MGPIHPTQFVEATFPRMSLERVDDVTVMGISRVPCLAFRVFRISLEMVASPNDRPT